jgi:hypothetical protein
MPGALATLPAPKRRKNGRSALLGRVPNDFVCSDATTVPQLTLLNDFSRSSLVDRTTSRPQEARD